MSTKIGLLRSNVLRCGIMFDVKCGVALLLIAFIWCYSLLSSRLTAPMLRVIVNERMYAFVARIFNLHQSGVLHSGIWLLHGWCHVKLPPSRRKFCV